MNRQIKHANRHNKPKYLFAPGFACTPTVWDRVLDLLPNLIATHVQWPTGLASVSEARDYLADHVQAQTPDVYVGHSLGGLLLLELLVAQRIPRRPTLIVDAFLSDPADLFKNFVWEDNALRKDVTSMLDAERPHFEALRTSISSWTHPGWPKDALETGAQFVYGGRGEDDARVIEALAWPVPIPQGQLHILSRTSHFLMLEAPSAFAELLRALH